MTLIVEATWAAIRVTRQAGESGAALVKAVEYALISVVEETGAQIEEISRLSVEAAGLALMCWCLYALYQWKKGRNEEVLFWSPPASPKKRVAKARARKVEDQSSLKLGIVSVDSLQSKARLEVKKTSERAALPPLEMIKDVSPRPKGKGLKKEQRKEVQKNPTESVSRKSPVLRVLSGALEAQEAALQVLEESAEAGNEARVWFTGYAVDRPEILAGLKVVQDAGCELKVTVDQAQSKRNAEQKKVLQQASSSGLAVSFANGNPLGPHYQAAGRGRLNFTGALHAKTLIAELPGQKQEPKKVLAILGSVNWTTASRGNHELAMLLEVDRQSQAGEDLIRWATEVAQHGKTLNEWDLQEISASARRRQHG